VNIHARARIAISSRVTYSMDPPCTVYHWCCPLACIRLWLRKNRTSACAGKSMISSFGVDQIAPEIGVR
jgi:hypothetical protein